MPNGWKKNAKYFNHLEMTHKEYSEKKNKFRKWKKGDASRGENCFHFVAGCRRRALFNDSLNALIKPRFFTSVSAIDEDSTT